MRVFAGVMQFLATVGLCVCVYEALVLGEQTTQEATYWFTVYILGVCWSLEERLKKR